MSIQTPFNDKVVLVTGAAAGIGESAARAFAAQGAKVVLADIDKGGEQVNYGKDTTVMSILDNIMSSCNGVLDDANGVGTEVNEVNKKSRTDENGR
jgi:NAD(P)-dependent dehydrogenase (short-subunit alcohol dehydrogenase family)